jgi:SAM-dependent methyltransferase
MPLRKESELSSAPEVPDYDRMWTDVYGDIQHFGPVHRHMRRIVSRLLAGLEYRSVLDIGCGPGSNFDLLARGRPGLKLAGIDISELALAKARELVSGEFWRIDIQREHVEGTWDLVHSSCVFEHLPDDVAALRHIRSMTGRYLLLTTIGGNFERYRPWDERVGHVRNYREGELERKLGDAGFEVLQSIAWGFPFYSPIERELLNHRRIGELGVGSYPRSTRLLADLLYWLYYLNSSRRGDLLIVLARV